VNVDLGWDIVKSSEGRGEARRMLEISGRIGGDEKNSTRVQQIVLVPKQKTRTTAGQGRGSKNHELGAISAFWSLVTTRIAKTVQEVRQ